MNLPPLCRIRQRLPGEALADVRRELAARWRAAGVGARVRPGMRIGVCAGSRGIDALPLLVAGVVDELRNLGAHPFLLPAMGSHGGTTPAGQLELLQSMGVDPAALGVPADARMEAAAIGSLPGGDTVYTAISALEADGVVVINRVKPHTDFTGGHESGLTKMLAIGLGKETGAAVYHAHGARGLRELVVPAAEIVLGRLNVTAGVATVENGHGKVARVAVLPPEQIVAVEALLLAEARRLKPQLPVSPIDICMVDWLGKDVSGTGMDTFTIGRVYIAGEPDPPEPFIRCLCVLDLTPASHGNATGIGLADFTTRRLVEKIDYAAMHMNVITSGFPMRGKVPVFFDDDRRLLAAALQACARPDPRQVRFVRIRSTLHLEEMLVSQNLLPELDGKAELVRPDEPWRFEGERLSSPW